MMFKVSAGVCALSVAVAMAFVLPASAEESAGAPPPVVVEKAPAATVKKVVKPAAAAAGKEAVPVWKADEPAKPTVSKKSAATPAASATTKAATEKVKVKTVAAPSPCKGLDQKSCGGIKACDWIVPKDANDKTGKVQDPYCRKVAGVAAKKPVKKAAAKMTPAVAGAPVDKAPAAPPVIVDKTTDAATAAPKPMKKAVAKQVPAVSGDGTGAAPATAAKAVAPPAPAQ
ncbi:MAG: hypothetical protein ABL907_06590 [Hyphomicrobium sp.]